MKSDNNNQSSPYAITMWDFSWLERRWSGAGYEDWNLRLDELVDRGYNAIRLDAYPHLIANGAEKKWTLLPQWNQQDWGSPVKNVVRVQPELNQFLSACFERNIKVGLSSWFREDIDNVRMKIKTPEIMIQYWDATLQSIDKDLLDVVLFVDLCNEWPGISWAPFFKNEPPEPTWGAWYTEKSMVWMQSSVKLFKELYPDIPITFSFDANESEWTKTDLSFLDFLDPHIWMAQQNSQEYYQEVNYTYPLFSGEGYEMLVENAQSVYFNKRAYWDQLLVNRILSIASTAREQKTPLITTECWGLVDYKDWPLLEWDWIKQLCALGTRTAANTGRWMAIATSNFCGPQFTGMWNDISWHQALTSLIRSSKIEPDMKVF